VIDVPDRPPPRVWGSFGYGFSREGDLAALKDLADQRLYEDKRRSKGATGGPVTEPALVVEDLTVRFGDFTAVDRVSLRVERGEIFGFLGRQRRGQNHHHPRAHRACWFPTAGTGHAWRA
jgi:hypothetical protein